MAEGCEIENNIDIKESPAQVAKERFPISQKLISNANSSSTSNTGCIKELTKVRKNNINNATLATFDERKVIGQGIFYIYLINETKVDAPFPVNQFCINDFSTRYRSDRNRNGGGVNINVPEDITSKILTKHMLPDDIEALFTEINF